MNSGMNESITGMWPSVDSRLSHPGPRPPWPTETLPSCLLTRSQSVNTEPDTQTPSAPRNAFNQALLPLPNPHPRLIRRVRSEHVLFPALVAVVEHRRSGWDVGRVPWGLSAAQLAPGGPLSPARQPGTHSGWGLEAALRWGDMASPPFYKGGN